MLELIEAGEERRGEEEVMVEVLVVEMEVGVRWWWWQRRW